MTAVNAPIALFVYNRPWHTEQTLSALARNHGAKDTDLIIFSDGPRSEPDDNVDAVRQLITDYRGFRSVKVVQRPENLGLADSIISGVTQVLKDYDSIIVVEDDLVTSPGFLNYMNQSLEHYANDDRVISIHGYCYPVPDLPDFFFIKGADCWGWATWKRGWSLFNSDGKQLLDDLKERSLLSRFDMNDSWPYTRMLKANIAGKNDSWAIRWYASALLHDKLTLYPGQSYVHNIGNDGSGQHRLDADDFESASNEDPVLFSPVAVTENLTALNQMSVWMRKHRPGLLDRLLARLRR